jgi:hypothetical protein
VTAAEQHKSLQAELEAAAKVAIGQEQAATAKLHAELRTIRSKLSAAQQAAAGSKEEAEQQQQSCSHSWTLHSSKRQLRGRSWTEPRRHAKSCRLSCRRLRARLRTLSSSSLMQKQSTQTKAKLLLMLKWCLSAGS